MSIPTQESDRRARRVGIAVSHLVHEQEITDQQRVLHRPGRNPEWLEKQRAETARNQQRIDNCFDRSRHLRLPVVSSAILASSVASFSATCEGAAALSRRYASRWQRFDQHKCLRPRVIIGQSDVNDGLVPRWRHLHPSRSLAQPVTSITG